MIISERHCNYEVILIKAHWVVRFGELLDMMWPFLTHQVGARPLYSLTL